MEQGKGCCIYWDASAVLSVLVKDSHSETAQRWIRKTGLHLLSTLAYAEVVSVLDRMERENFLTRILLQSASQELLEGPWRFLNVCPARDQMDSLRGKYALRGADFWHLALVGTVKREISELMFMTFDQKLQDGAEKEGFSCPP
jgi:predicted nucleic acid-binding protein